MKYKTHNWELLHNAIVEDLQCMSLPDVARKHQLNYHTLMSYCSRMNIERPIKKRAQPQLPSSYFTKLKELHKEGKSIKELSHYFGYCERSISRALNFCYLPSEDAITDSERVYANSFRREIGIWFDKCFEDGQIVIQSHLRGEMVLMTAGQYNWLMKKINDQKDS